MALKSNPFCILRKSALHHVHNKTAATCTCGTKISQTRLSLVHAIAAFGAEEEPRMEVKWEDCTHVWVQGNDETLLQLSKELECRDLYSTEVTHVLPAGKEDYHFAPSLLCAHVDG